MNPLNLSGATRWGMNAVLLLCVVLALYLGQTVIVPVVIALLLAAMLWPFAAWIHRDTTFPGVKLTATAPWLAPCRVRLRIPWTVACGVVIGVLVTVLVLVPLCSGLAVARMLQDLPRDEMGQQEAYTRFRGRVAEINSAVAGQYLPPKADDSAVFKALKNLFDPGKEYFIDALKQVAGYGGSWLWQAILITFILLFLMLEGPMLTRRVVEIFGPSAEAQKKAVEALEAMANQVRVYLFWRTIVNAGLALILGVVYQLLGLHDPWFWALLTALLCYIPYVGQIVAGIPPVLDAFLCCASPWYAVVVLVVYVVVMTVEGYLVVPVVMGRPMRLNATTVLLACLFWHLVWGTPGLFLAMPLMAGIKAICTHVPGWEAWANLMSTHEPEQRAPEQVSVEAMTNLSMADTEVLSPAEAQARFNAIQAAEHRRD